MKMHRRIVKRLRMVARAFNWTLRKAPARRFEDSAYYAYYRGALVSLTGYPRWKEAYRAAKSFHSKAFIIKGSTLNRSLSESQWKGLKQMWRGYAAR